MQISLIIPMFVPTTKTKSHVRLYGFSRRGFLLAISLLSRSWNAWFQHNSFLTSRFKVKAEEGHECLTVLHAQCFPRSSE